MPDKCDTSAGGRMARRCKNPARTEWYVRADMTKCNAAIINRIQDFKF